jgi:hypothetical protein
MGAKKRIKKVKKRRRIKGTAIGRQVVKVVTGTNTIQGQDLEIETTADETIPRACTRKGRTGPKTKKTSVSVLLVLTWLSTDRDCKRLKRLKICANSKPKLKA